MNFKESAPKICTIVFILFVAGIFSVMVFIGNKKENNKNYYNVIKSTTEDSIAWQRFTHHPNSIARILPATAMEVVKEVVGSLRPEARVIVKTPNGSLRGRIQSYKSGHASKSFYYSFRGIRYGQAPVGERRFREALPELPWRGVRKAISEGNNCPHRNMLLDTFKGNEDCLFINVFTPKLPDAITGNPTLPVMFWIHGGGFSFGSGNSFIFGPDYLIQEDVILVTINYRLGPLGFLALSPTDAPGNAGLKDQVLALKWVQNNIAAFGGDPNKVTIFGESAGAASVHYLLLSPLAKGLFHRAISESGSALNPWALATDPKERAFSLGRALGFETNNTAALLNFLRKVTPRDLVDAAPKTLTDKDARNNIGIPFVPSIEEELSPEDYEFIDPLGRDSNIITEHPFDLLRRGAANKVPYITGFNSEEAMLFIRRARKDPSLLDTIDQDFMRLVPNSLNVTKSIGDIQNPSEEAFAVMKSMRDFYLGTRHVSVDTVDEMIELLTDLMFIRGIVEGARFHATMDNQPTFVYRFGFDGALGLYKRLLGIARPGVCHGDELGYLFHFGFFNLSLDPSSPEIQVKNQMVTLWTNFAKYGHPTPQGANDPTLRVNWEPVNSDMSNLNYLDITSKLEAKINPEGERLLYWDTIYAKYGRVI